MECVRCVCVWLRAAGGLGFNKPVGTGVNS